MKKKQIKILFFIGMTILITTMMFSGYKSMQNPVDNVRVCLVEENIKAPVLKTITREKIVEIEKENIIYDFPFATEEIGTYNVKQVCPSCLENDKYPNMRKNSEVCIYATSDVLAEGTLVWVENIGIRQVQPLLGSSDSLYIVSVEHGSESILENCKVFKILE